VSNKPERVRVLDLWCPEIRSRDPEEKARGLAAKAFAETLLPPGTIVVFSSHVWDRTPAPHAAEASHTRNRSACPHQNPTLNPGS
jgi:hypothetical protein